MSEMLASQREKQSVRLQSSAFQVRHSQTRTWVCADVYVSGCHFPRVYVVLYHHIRRCLFAAISVMEQCPCSSAGGAVLRATAATTPASVSAGSPAAASTTRSAPAAAGAPASDVTGGVPAAAAAMPASGYTAARYPAAASTAYGEVVGSQSVAHDCSTHACVRTLRGQLLRRIGKKVRSNPLQNLECPTVFAILSIGRLPCTTSLPTDTTTTTSEAYEQESGTSFGGLPDNAAKPAGTHVAGEATPAARPSVAAERSAEGGTRRAAAAAAAATECATAEERGGERGEGRREKGQEGDNPAGPAEAACQGAARAAARQQFCPLEAASAVFVVFKGKFATLVSSDIVTAQDVLTIAGARCRPFYLPGGGEDLYSWGARVLRHLQGSVAPLPRASGAAPLATAAASSSLLLQRACLTHYVTLSDTHADAQIDIEPHAPPASGGECEPFCISAAELLTSAVLPACLPLPRWLVERNSQAERSIFRGRVLQASVRVEREQQQQRRPRRQQQQQEQHKRRKANARQQNEPLQPHQQQGRTTHRWEGELPQQERQHQENRWQAAQNLQRQTVRRQQAEGQEGDQEGTHEPASGNSSGSSTMRRMEENRGNPKNVCDPTEAGDDEGGEHSEEDEEASYPGGSINRRSRVEYTYSTLKELEPHQGANFYGIVWEVTKALMPSPGGGRGRGPSSFYMNIAVFDESVPFTPGVDTAPGGGIEEYSLALKTRGTPVDIPCVSVGDIVRVHRAKVGVKYEAERQFVNIGSVVNLTSARIWPLEAWEEEPSAGNTLIIGSGEHCTTVTRDDALRIQALRYHAHQLLSSSRLFATQYYKTLAQLRDAAATTEAYGDLIVRVVRHGMTQCCRLLEGSAAAAKASLCLAFSWLRGEASAPEPQQYDSELSAYLLLVEDASMPGGEVAVCCLPEATAEQFAASDNPLREGQWLRLRNFRWCNFQLEEIQLACGDLLQQGLHAEQPFCICQTFFCIQPSRPELARVTRLPSFSLDVLLAEQQLQEALQHLKEQQQWSEWQQLEEVPERLGGHQLHSHMQQSEAGLQTDSKQQTQLQQTHTHHHACDADSLHQHRDTPRQRDLQRSRQEEEACCYTCQHGRARGYPKNSADARQVGNDPCTEQRPQQQEEERQNQEVSQGMIHRQQKCSRGDERQVEYVYDIDSSNGQMPSASCRTLQERQHPLYTTGEQQVAVEGDALLPGNQKQQAVPVARPTGSKDVAEDGGKQMLHKGTDDTRQRVDDRAATAVFSLRVPQELLDKQPTPVLVVDRLKPLLTNRPSVPPLTGPVLLRRMRVTALGPPAEVDADDPRTWVVTQCLLCQSKQRLKKSNPALLLDEAHARTGGEGDASLFWCSNCRHADPCTLLFMYSFSLVLADADGDSLEVEIKDATGSRFMCLSEKGISPYFSASDARAQALLRSFMAQLLDDDIGTVSVRHIDQRREELSETLTLNNGSASVPVEKAGHLANQDDSQKSTSPKQAHPQQDDMHSEAGDFSVDEGCRGLPATDPGGKKVLRQKSLETEQQRLCPLHAAAAARGSQPVERDGVFSASKCAAARNLEGSCTAAVCGTAAENGKSSQYTSYKPSTENSGSQRVTHDLGRHELIVKRSGAERSDGRHQWVVLGYDIIKH